MERELYKVDVAIDGEHALSLFNKNKYVSVYIRSYDAKN